MEAQNDVINDVIRGSNVNLENDAISTCSFIIFINSDSHQILKNG